MIKDFGQKMGRISIGKLIIVLAASLLVKCSAQTPFDCPQDWFSFSDHCYHFVIYPTLPYDEASQACHQDGASVLNINSGDENTFIISLLPSVDGLRSNLWYTSGQQRNGLRQWAGDGSSFSAADSYWIIDPSTEAQVANNLIEAQLVYRFSDARSAYGWTWASRTYPLPYICEISLNEVYRITQRDRDFSFGQTSMDPNDWTVGPRFTVLSPSTVFTPGVGQFSLECAADGVPAPTYKWYKDYGTEHERLITASDRYTVTNGRFTVSHPTRESEPGVYTCVAENSVGSVLGNPVLVAAGYVGEFSNDKPGSRTAVMYQGAVIDCSPPRFSPALMFQWMKDDRFIRPEMNPHTYLSENGKLYLSEVQAADAAEYKCIVTLAAGSDQVLANDQPQYRMSLPIPLVIRGENPNEFGPDIHDDFPAVFPQQPLAGLDMRIECLAYGRLPLHYSWSRGDGREIPQERASFTSLNRVLQIRRARLEDSGTYLCTVSGPTNTRSKNITISIAAAPYFMFPLRDQHLDVGRQLTWVCDAVAIPRASYAWYKDGRVLLSDPARDIQVTLNVLTIASAQAANHNGMYECRATNDHGTQISIAQIRVLAFQPSFNRQPVEPTLVGTVGGNLTVKCRPEGAPEPAITWSHNGSPITTSAGRIQILRNGNLVLTALSYGDAGVYTCTADNSLGSASSSGRLSIMRETVMTNKPMNQVVTQNSTASIPCQASYAVDQSDLVYLWYLNGHPVDFANDVSFRVTEYSDHANLNIISAQFKHEGWYECRATTVYDSVNARAYLTVMGTPDQPAGVHVHSHVGTEVTLWWQPGKNRGEEVTQYRIDVSNNYNSTWLTLVSGIPAHQTQVSEYPQWRQYVISADMLSPGTRYQFRVAAASSSFGYGLQSMESDEVKMDDAAPTHAVQFVSGGGGSTGMLRVQWLPLPPEFHGGEGLFYRVYWRLHRNQNDQWESSKEPIVGDNPDNDGFVYFHYKVGLENYYTQYDVMVQVLNSMGPGPNSTVETIYSAEDIPVTTPQNVYAIGLNATAVKVYWQLPNNTRQGLRGTVLGYQINWYLWGHDNERGFINFIRYYGQQMSGIVIGLPVANGDYWMEVQVFNTAGLSRPSGRAYQSTNYNAPLHYPEFVTVQSHGPGSVWVTWRGVSTQQIEATVSGYTIWYWPYTNDIRSAKKVVLGKVFGGVISGLEEDMIYKLRIMATSLGGEGKKSPPTYFTLGGEVRFDPLTSEILATAVSITPSTMIVLLLTIVSRLFIK